jgi:hypothetical protein
MLVKHIRGPDSPPVLLWESIVGQRLFDRCLDELGGFGQAQPAQFLDHSDNLLACRADVLQDSRMYRLNAEAKPKAYRLS